jgi:hypothetical protein
VPIGNSLHDIPRILFPLAFVGAWLDRSFNGRPPFQGYLHHKRLSFTVTGLANSLSLSFTYCPHHTAFTASTHTSTRSTPLKAYNIHILLNMFTTLLFGALFATSLAAPLAQTSLEPSANSTWTPAPDSKTACDSGSDKIIGFYVGPQLETVLNDACAEMMDPCAYRERLPPNTVCVQTVTWPLKGPVKSQQAADVQDLNGNKLSPWNVQCKSTIH